MKAPSKRLDNAPHVLAWRKNIAEVDRLLEIHKQLSGDAPGRRRDVQVLNKSALIMLLACWEAYVEDLAKNSFEFMLEKASSPKIFPDFVLAIAGKEVKNGGAVDLWSLAGSGWKTALQHHKQKILDKYIVKSSFNTPSAENIDKLFSELIGLTAISREWFWPKMKNDAALTKLKNLIERRCEIAHRVESSSPVLKKDIEIYRSLISRMAVITHNRALALIYLRTKRKPWRRYRFGKTS